MQGERSVSVRRARMNRERAHWLVGLVWAHCVRHEGKVSNGSARGDETAEGTHEVGGGEEERVIEDGRM